MRRVRARLATFLALLQRWAEAGWAGSVLYSFGVVQSSIVPGPADVLFVPLAVANPRRAYYFALAATAGTLSGSTLLFFIGRGGLDLVEGTLAMLLGMTPDSLASARATLSEYGGWGIFLSTISPISTKLTSLASGAVEVPFVEFLAFLAAGRGLRTFVIAWVVRNGGAAWVRRVIGVPGKSATTAKLKAKR